MAVAGKREARPGSYPVLVVSRELGDLDCCDEQEGTSSIFVMTTLDLEFQRMVEDVSEPMLGRSGIFFRVGRVAQKGGQPVESLCASGHIVCGFP